MESDREFRRMRRTAGWLFAAVIIALASLIAISLIFGGSSPIGYPPFFSSAGGFSFLYSSLASFSSSGGGDGDTRGTAEGVTIQLWRLSEKDSPEVRSQRNSTTR